MSVDIEKLASRAQTENTYVYLPREELVPVIEELRAGREAQDGVSFWMSKCAESLKRHGETRSALTAAQTRIAVLEEALRPFAEGGTTHGPGCHTWGRRHYECLEREFAAAQARIAALTNPEPQEPK